MNQPEWLVKCKRKHTIIHDSSQWVTHLSSNPVQCTATRLTCAMPLPLHHTAPFTATWKAYKFKQINQQLID